MSFLAAGLRCDNGVYLRSLIVDKEALPNNFK